MLQEDQINIANEQLNLVCLGYYVMWRDRACICFKNHGTIIEFQVWCSNKTNIFPLSFDYTHSETYNWEKSQLKKILGNLYSKSISHKQLLFLKNYRIN